MASRPGQPLAEDKTVKPRPAENRRVVAVVACPYCHAPAGTLCTDYKTLGYKKAPHESRVKSATGKTPAPPNAWKRVIFSSDCDEDGNCPRCKTDYGDCPCIGPTEDDVDYRERNGVLQGRRRASTDADSPS